MFDFTELPQQFFCSIPFQCWVHDLEHRLEQQQFHSGAMDEFEFDWLLTLLGIWLPPRCRWHHRVGNDRPKRENLAPPFGSSGVNFKANYISLALWHRFGIRLKGRKRTNNHHLMRISGSTPGGVGSDSLFYELNRYVYWIAYFSVLKFRQLWAARNLPTQGDVG